jgi:hypothetical protein
LQTLFLRQSSPHIATEGGPIRRTASCADHHRTGKPPEEMLHELTLQPSKNETIRSVLELLSVGARLFQSQLKAQTIVDELEQPVFCEALWLGAGVSFFRCAQASWSDQKRVAFSASASIAQADGKGTPCGRGGCVMSDRIFAHRRPNY